MDFSGFMSQWGTVNTYFNYLNANTTTLSAEMCNLFKWSTASGGAVALGPSSTPRQVYDTLSRRGLSVYRECRVKKKSNSNLYLVNLPFTDKHHNYNKEDVWILNPGRALGEP